MNSGYERHDDPFGTVEPGDGGTPAGGEAREAAALARIVLVRMPRHLATYQRLVRAAWALKRHQEGEDGARRLLQADPGNALAWRSLAYAVEQKRCGTPRARCGSERLRRTPIYLTSRRAEPHQSGPHQCNGT